MIFAVDIMHPRGLVLSDGNTGLVMTLQQIKKNVTQIKEHAFRDSVYGGIFFIGVGAGLLFASPFTENDRIGIVAFSVVFLGIGTFLIRLKKSEPKLPEPD